MYTVYYWNYGERNLDKARNLGGDGSTAIKTVTYVTCISHKLIFCQVLSSCFHLKIMPQVPQVLSIWSFDKVFVGQVQTIPGPWIGWDYSRWVLTTMGKIKMLEIQNKNIWINVFFGKRDFKQVWFQRQLSDSPLGPTCISSGARPTPCYILGDWLLIESGSIPAPKLKAWTEWSQKWLQIQTSENQCDIKWPQAIGWNHRLRWGATFLKGSPCNQVAGWYQILRTCGEEETQRPWEAATVGTIPAQADVKVSLCF